MAESERLLVQFPALLLSAAFPSQRLLRATLVARLQIERVLLDILDDIFLLHLSLEAAQGAFDGFAFLDFYFSQASIHPLTGWHLWPHAAPNFNGAEWGKRSF